MLNFQTLNIRCKKNVFLYLEKVTRIIVVCFQQKKRTYSLDLESRPVLDTITYDF